MDNERMAERLRTLRGGRTQAEVAEAVGITQSSLSMYEKGVRVPRDEVKVRLAEYYKRSVKYIFYA